MQSTPWGHADSVKEIAPGIHTVSTPSHGGFHVSDELLAQMPFALRMSNSYSGTGSDWFEEDCEWALPVLAFPALFGARYCHHAVRTVDGRERKAGEYFYSAAQWLASPAGDAVRAKAGTFIEAAA